MFGEFTLLISVVGAFGTFFTVWKYAADHPDKRAELIRVLAVAGGIFSVIVVDTILLPDVRRGAINKIQNKYQDKVAKLSPADQEKFNKYIEEGSDSYLGGGLSDRVGKFWFFYALAFLFGLYCGKEAGDYLLPNSKPTDSQPTPA